MPTTKHLKGFTLIEIMVVISIIAFLSSMVFTSLAVAKIKAQDSARTQTARQVDLAIKSYILDTKAAPLNYTSNGEFAYSDAIPDGSGMNAFQKSMKLLVDAGYLSKIPEQVGSVPFFYYNFGGTTGAVFGTALVAGELTTTGPSNSCRPLSEPSQTQCDTLMADTSFTGCTWTNLGRGPYMYVCGADTPYPTLQYCPAFIASKIESIQSAWGSNPPANEAAYLANVQLRPYFYTYGISYSSMQYLYSSSVIAQQRCSGTTASTDVCYCSPI